MALSTAYQDVITNNMSIPITPTSTKSLQMKWIHHRSEIRNALKTLSPDGDCGTVTKELVTGCLSPITIIELFNTTSRSIDILIDPIQGYLNYTSLTETGMWKWNDRFCY